MRATYTATRAAFVALFLCPASAFAAFQAVDATVQVINTRKCNDTGGGTYDYVHNYSLPMVQASLPGPLGATIEEAKLLASQLNVGKSIACDFASATHTFLMTPQNILGINSSGLPDYPDSRYYFTVIEVPDPPACPDQGTEIYARFAANIETLSSYMQSGNEYADTQGCGYTVVSGVATCAEDAQGSYCALRLSSTGQPSTGELISQPVGTSTPLPTSTIETKPYDVTTTTEVGAPSDGCTPGEIAETCISTVTEYTVENLPESMRWDAEAGTVTLIDSGTRTATIETVTTTVTDNVTGEQVVTQSSSTTNYSSGATTTTIGATGLTTTTGTPVSNASTSTVTQSLDALGNVTSSTTTATSETDPIAEEDYTDEVNNLRDSKGDFSAFDTEIGTWVTPPDILANKAPSTSILAAHFAGQAACPATLFEWEVQGITGSFDVCPYVGYAQDFLYWVFAIMTLATIYYSWLSAFRS